MPLWRRAFGTMRDNGRRGGRFSEDDGGAAMMAAFGGFFGLLLVFLVLVNLFTGEAARERLESAGENGLFRIERPDKRGSGFVVITFPASLRIVETGEEAQPGGICAHGGAPFAEYARRVYANRGDQLVFFMLEGSVPVMAEARECLRNLWHGRSVTIGWVIADNELLKSVTLGDIPDYIRDYVEEKP